MWIASARASGLRMVLVARVFAPFVGVGPFGLVRLANGIVQCVMRVAFHALLVPDRGPAKTESAGFRKGPRRTELSHTLTHSGRCPGPRRHTVNRGGTKHGRLGSAALRTSRQERRRSTTCPLQPSR